jgi:hypothetical protein
VRAAAWELLPVSPATLDETRVWLYYIARASVDLRLRPVVEEQWQGRHEYLVALLQIAKDREQLAANVDVRRAAIEYHAIVDDSAWPASPPGSHERRVDARADRRSPSGCAATLPDTARWIAGQSITVEAVCPDSYSTCCPSRITRATSRGSIGRHGTCA